MKRPDVVLAAQIIEMQDSAKELRATLHGNDYELGLFAECPDKETMHDTFKVPNELGRMVMDYIIIFLADKIRELGVEGEPQQLSINRSWKDR